MHQNWIQEFSDDDFFEHSAQYGSNRDWAEIFTFHWLARLLYWRDYAGFPLPWYI